MRKRLVELIGGRDDVVWASLQALGDDAIGAARLLERRLHHGKEDAGARRELHVAALQADDTLRDLNRHLHNAFAAPLERDDALALGSAFDRVVQACADIGAALEARGEDRGRHEARRASSLLAAGLAPLVAALDDLAAARASGDASAEARALLAQGRDFVREGLGDVLGAQLPAEELLSWKDLYDRLDLALGAVRDAERLIDALEPRGSDGSRAPVRRRSSTVGSRRS